MSYNRQQKTGLYVNFWNMKQEIDQDQIKKRIQELIDFSQSSDDSKRIEAAQVFARVCFRDDLPRKDEILDRMKAMIDDPSREVRLHLVPGFRFMAGPAWGRAWPERDPKLLKDVDRKTLEYTADSLLKLTRDSDPEVQQEALYNLGITGFVGVRKKEIEDRCLGILDEGKDNKLYPVTIDQLAIMRSEDPRVRENLLERLSDDNEHQRIRALQGLREVGRAEDLERVAEMKPRGSVEDFNIKLTTEYLEGFSQERSSIEKE